MSTPASLYRNAIDLNRFSNSVAKQIVLAYNDVILSAVAQLRVIDELSAPVKAARLRGILAQLKETLGTWSGNATQAAVGELQGIALLQSDFVADQLRRALPAGARDMVRTVEISPAFAQSVATVDPTQVNVVTLSDDLQAAVTGAPQTYSLTAAQGATVTLPNGQVLEKAFRGIATSQAERFNQLVRTGLLEGQTTQQIIRQLVGKLEFGQEARTLSQLSAAGGQITTVANNQVTALMRTSVNQVANAASQQVYEANQDVTKKYRYVATLDSRTSPICRRLDGREYEYGKGPTPPQHFNCRSTTVPVINYEELGFTPPPQGKRASMDGPVPADLTYGEWLAKQSRDTQAEVLGPSKVGYYKKLVDKYGPTQAISKFVRDDGSELTLDELRQRYGPAEP